MKFSTSVLLVGASAGLCHGQASEIELQGAATSIVMDGGESTQVTMTAAQLKLLLGGTSTGEVSYDGGDSVTDYIFLGQLGTNTVNRVSISDAGCNSGGAVSYEITSGYNPTSSGIPVARTLGSSTYPNLANRLEFKFKPVAGKTTAYFLYVAVPNWGCGVGKMHTLKYSIEHSPPNYTGAQYVHPSALTEAYDAASYLDMEVVNLSVKESVDYKSTVRYDGGDGVEDSFFLGRLSSQVVNTIYISDEGCNSGGTISYEIVSGYKPSQHGIPTARTNGDSNRYPDLWKKLRFEFREATATSFYLYTFLPNWGCGAGAMHNFYFDIKFSPNNYPNSYSSPDMISDAYDSSTYTAMSISNVQEDLTMAFQHFSLTFLPITAESSYSTSYTVNHAPYADSEACSVGDMKFQNCIYFHAANEAYPGGAKLHFNTYGQVLNRFPCPKGNDRVFMAFVGLHESTNVRDGGCSAGGGNVNFYVHADGVKIAGPIYAEACLAKPIKIRVTVPTGTEKLSLVTDNGGDNHSWDHAMWGNPLVTCSP